MSYVAGLMSKANPDTLQIQMSEPFLHVKMTRFIACQRHTTVQRFFYYALY